MGSESLDLNLSTSTTPEPVACLPALPVPEIAPFAQVYSPRYPGNMASTVDKDKLHDVLEEAVIVIDAEAFERSQKDPRVKDLFKRGKALHSELDAKNANF